jgi:hypothetical protein
VDVKLTEEQRLAMQQNLGPMIGMMVPLLIMQGTPNAPNPLQMLMPRQGKPSE